MAKKVKTAGKVSAKKSKGEKKTVKKKAASSKGKKSRTSAKKAAPAKKSSKRRASSLTLKGITLTKKELFWAYREMLRARLCDEKIIVLYKQNKCHFQIGVAGHEAVQVAASMIFKPGVDWFYPYYRDMALCAGLGMSTEEFMLNAMNKDADPNSHGRQMPMHYGSKELHIVSQSSPTGTQLLQAVGCAMASKKTGKKDVTYVSIGEGACAQGDFHEAINWAAREKLPVVFLVENNTYAISVPIWEEITGESVYKITAGYEGLAREEIDGTDIFESYKAFKKAYQRAKRGRGPTLIEAKVPRLQSHSISDNHLKYRTPEEIEKEKKRCPIKKLKELLISKKIASKAELEAVEEELREEIDKAAEWAERQPDPDPAEADTEVFFNDNPQDLFEEKKPFGEEAYMVDALNKALDEEMAREEGMYIFGQDVAGGKGGVFTVTQGLTAKYGEERVFNAPLAESSIVGVAIGMATRGLKPVVEIQFGDYIWTAMMQIRNELAVMSYRSKGDWRCPAVVRVAVGGYIRGGCYHSQCIESFFAHIPGLYIAFPSNATDAKGLLKAAIRMKDPVLFLEHKGLYRQVYSKGLVGDSEFLIPFGKAKIVREGEDLTVVAWGALVHKSLEAAKKLEEEYGYSVEVIDLRTVVPLDFETIALSVKKTSRVVVAQEDVVFMGFAAEVSAQIADKLFQYLDAPVGRVGMKYVPAVPHAPILEDAVLPQIKDVEKAMLETLQF
ncbi:MAG: tungsten formylmethanofuran dehydrogenase [Candidatus Dadabacteria bacterium]|nr:MAG: tungsten formylmethanofuran dehydrogenase [Candidatus Dadabacteria bacterium]